MILILVLTLIIFAITWVFVLSKKKNTSQIELIEIQNFLTEEECDEIIKMSEPLLADSHVYDSDNDNVQKESRISKQCWFNDDRHKLIEYISNKCANATSTNKTCQEQLQVVKYTEGGFFNPHFDPCVGDAKFCERMNKGSGHRKYTVLIYLNDDFEGGETEFPDLGIKIYPQKGKAVIFKSVDEEGNIIKESKHGGNSVTKGEKWVCNKWIHFHDYPII
jgi:prolyl 4-hydroxylase